MWCHAVKVGQYYDELSAVARRNAQYWATTIPKPRYHRTVWDLGYTRDVKIAGKGSPKSKIQLRHLGTAPLLLTQGTHLFKCGIKRQ